MRTLLITAAAVLLPGCALMPDSIPVEMAHVSHASQHFQAHPTNYGYDAIYTGFKWKRGNFSFKLEEGYVKEHLDGLHEVFQGSVEYNIPLKR